MKKIFLLFFLFYTLILLQAQNSIPNAGFENWITTGYSYPTQYDMNINKDAAEYSSGIVFPLTKVAGYQSLYGVQLQTTSELGMAFCINYNPENQNPLTWHGGIPLAEKPTGVHGYYKYNVASGDQAMLIIVFSKSGTNIGTYTYYLSGLHVDYTPFDFTFSPELTQTPDSVIVAFASSGFNGAKTGSTLVMDKISFTGLTSQPNLLNGDFEEWTDVSSESLADWYGDNQGSEDAVKKTTDVYKGTYAVELKTYLGEQDNQPAARPAQIMNGYYGNNCDGNCYPLGGSPFTNQSDVLEFYYKYIPVGKDIASVDLYFKSKDGNNDGWYGHTELNSSPDDYTYAEIPFNLGFLPDSVIIQFSSSSWNTVSMSTIGSTLKIDDVVFRSQKTGLENIFTKYISLYPNPTDDGFYLSDYKNVNNISVYDVKGVKVLYKISPEGFVDVRSLQKGIYIVEIQSQNAIYKAKLMKK